MNVAGVFYYGSSWTFVDLFKSGGGCCWPHVRSGTDVNGWPLEINSTLDDDGSYWITGRNLMGQMQGYYPAGEYTLNAQGSGQLRLAFDSGNRWIQGMLN